MVNHHQGPKEPQMINHHPSNGLPRSFPKSLGMETEQIKI